MTVYRPRHAYRPYFDARIRIDQQVFLLGSLVQPGRHRLEDLEFRGGDAAFRGRRTRIRIRKVIDSRL